jgi:MFS transporter, DHA3 family, macrolide efflux protein
VSFKELLANHEIVRRMSAVQLIAYFGSWFSNVAIYSMLVEFGASSLVIATVTAMHLIPGIILSPFSGTFVDRISAKPLMVMLLTTEMSMTFCFLMIGSLDDVWLLLIFLFIRMGSASVFFTTQMSYMPKLLSGEVLVKTNELHSIIWSLTFTAGMAAGGVVVNLFGVKTAFIIDGLLFIIAISILTRIEFTIKTAKVVESVLTSIKKGLYYIKENKHIIHYMILHASVGLTMFDAIVTLLADYYYKYVIAVPLAIGLSNSIRAFALMIGPLLISNWVNRQRLLYLFIFQGIAIIFWAVIQDNFYAGLFGMFITGLATTTIWSYTYAMLQEQVEPSYLGRVLAYNEMMFMLSNVITTFFIGIFATLIPLSFISSLLGVGFLIMAIYYRRVFL